MKRLILAAVAVALTTSVANAELVTTTLGTDAGPATLATTFTAGLTIPDISTKPDMGGDVLVLSHDIVFTDLDPEGSGTTITPSNINSAQNQIVLAVDLNVNADRLRTNFTRRGGPVGAGNQGQFYGLSSAADGGGGFAFDGFDNMNEVGITNALSGQTSATFEYRMVLTNDLAVGVAGTSSYTLKSEVVDSAGTVLYVGGEITGLDLTGIFGAAVPDYDISFGTFNVDYVVSTTISNGVVTLTRDVETSVLYGDVDLSGEVNFLDIPPFITVLSGGTFQAEADCDMGGTVDFLDIAPFIAILSGP